MVRLKAASLALGLIAILAVAFAVAQDSAGTGDSERTVKLQVRGGEPVIQLLPGSSPFADEARPVIERLPDDVRGRQKQMAEDGPFTNRVVPITGEFVATFRDRGASGDHAEGEATFTTDDGTKWRVVIKGVTPDTNHPGFEPRFGGVAVDKILHGNTGVHTPLKPKVKAAVAWWGPADVYHRGSLIARDTPAHVMLSTATRGDDFKYACYDCTSRNMEQLHLIVPRPAGNPLPSTGGFLHVSWEKSTYVRSDSGAESLADERPQTATDERIRIRVRKDGD